MKEFWLAILKNIITYVLMIVIVIVGGISITSQKFPPEWSQIVSALNTLKDGYVSMINLRKQLGGMSQPMPNAADLSEHIANATATAPQGRKSNESTADAELQTTLALLKSMSHQMAPQQNLPETTAVTSDPEMKKYLITLEKQNQEMIERMDKIQTYLAWLHQYLAQTAPRQPVHQSAVQQVPPSRSLATPQPANAVVQQNIKK